MPLSSATPEISAAPLASLLERTGLAQARQAADDSDYAAGLVRVIDAVSATPDRLWRGHDVLELAEVVSVFNLDRILVKTAGFDFADLVDRARIAKALRGLAESEASVDEIAETYRPPRTRAQQLKELHANIVVTDNKLSSRENLDAAFERVLDLGLAEAARLLRP